MCKVVSDQEWINIESKADENGLALCNGHYHIVRNLELVCFNCGKRWKKVCPSISC